MNKLLALLTLLASACGGSEIDTQHQQQASQEIELIQIEGNLRFNYALGFDVTNGTACGYNSIDFGTPVLVDGQLAGEVHQAHWQQASDTVPRLSTCLFPFTVSIPDTGAPYVLQVAGVEKELSLDELQAGEIFLEWTREQHPLGL